MPTLTSERPGVRLCAAGSQTTRRCAHESSRQSRGAAARSGPLQKARITLLKFLQVIAVKKVVMGSYEIEIILNRQLADCLSIPVFITDTAGDLIFYNEPAEQILGKRFEETGEMPNEEWSTAFKPLDENGNQLPPEELPLVKTLNEVYPCHKSLRIESLNGVMHDISVTSYPIISRSGKFLGAVAIFWKRR